MPTVICENKWHRSTTVEVDDEEHEVSFEMDAERGVAVAEVPSDVAEALAKRDTYEIEETPTGEETDPPSELEGIGSAYERELAEADIETVAGLANADPETLAPDVSVDEETVFDWIGAAEAYV